MGALDFLDFRDLLGILRDDDPRQLAHQTKYCRFKIDIALQ
jgi:hypothetical protein